MRKYINKYLNFTITLEKRGYYTDLSDKRVILDTEKFIVNDTYSNHADEVFNSELDALRYINRLLKAKDKKEYLFVKWSTRAGVRENTIVEFSDGKRGIILESLHFDSCLKYKQIKKNGEPGKQIKKFYRHMDYKIINY